MRRSAPVHPPIEQTRLGIGERPAEPGDFNALPSLQVLGQSGGTYIVVTSPESVHLIDQHAAHERVVYERLRQREAGEPLEQQTLLLPVPVTLPPELRTILSAQRDTLAAWGFTLERAADVDLQVTAVPAGLQEGEVVATLAELGEQLLTGEDAPPAARRDSLLATIACHSAIRAGQTLSRDEMQQLLDQLEQCAQPRTCPHGRPTMLTLSHRQLERQFGRKG
jgi:DNA mismatch repair protein MutL